MKMISPEDLSLKNILEKLNSLSSKQKIIVLLLIWMIIFVPLTVDHSYMQRDEHYHFYPVKRGPEDYDPPDWDVRTRPLSMEEQTDRGWFLLNATAGDEIGFEWIWKKSPEKSSHIGAVDILYEENGSSELKTIRLRKEHENSTEEVWGKNVTFDEDKGIRYYFRVGRTDIPTFERRASLILEGENPYEEARTGPPPLIHFLFIPPTVLSAPVALGGAFLSFNIYFSLFVLLSAFLLFFSLREFDESKAFLSSMIFILNPITVFTVHQDEPIIVFLMILPLFLILRGKKYLSSAAVGLGTVAKVWTAFWIPIFFLYEGLREIKTLLTMILSGLSIFLLFVFMWGEKVLWFLTFYGGTAGKKNLGGISIWNLGLKLFKVNAEVLPTSMILLGILLAELLIWWLAWKRNWRPVSALVSFIIIFLAFYPKIHWEYVLLVLPFLSILATEEQRYLILFYIITALSSITMLLLRSDSVPVILAFFASLLLAASFIYVLVSIYKEGGNISDIDFKDR
ncbi:MAG: DUF2029 domain-containing protein [Candidatus Thermoplasmatota archaeon]|nr:DUF2029 domain-containing protein [Candidatus Thermoplasmatota archaeon]